MKIKQKLLFCFLALSLLTLAVTYFADVANHQETIESFQKVAGESLPGNIALARMTTELYYTLELVSRFSEEQNHGYEKKIGKALATLSTFKTMYFLYLPEEGEWHEKIDETIQRFSSYITEYILLMKRGGTEEELKKVVLKAAKSEDLQYNLEILSLIAQIGERKEFAKMVKKAIPLLEVEQDLQDLLDVCRDFYRYHDLDTEEQSIQSLIKLRDDRSAENSLDQKDPYFPKLLKIISK